MTTWILAITLSFTAIHAAGQSSLETIIHETWQRPLDSEYRCNLYAKMREDELRKNLMAVGIAELEFNYTCLPVEEES